MSDTASDHADAQMSEYKAATTAVALFDLSQRTSIELRGSDRRTFLNNFVTNDVKRLAPGDGCEAFLTNIKGRILGHLLIAATDEALWIDSEPGTAAFIKSHLDKYLIAEDVELADRSAELSPLLLVGPRAESWLTERVAGFESPKLWGQTDGKLDGTDVMIRRAGFTEPPGFLVIPAATDAEEVRQTITAAGVPSAGEETFEVLRIEAGFPRSGVDLTEDNIAQESGRAAQAISFTKGCYLGQEPIARLDALGHTNKELRRLRLASGPGPAAGMTVENAEGDAVGHITSAALSPGTGLPVAIAMLKRSVLSPGTEVRVCDATARVESISSGDDMSR